MRKQPILAALILFAASSSVSAAVTAPIPEPGVLELLSIGGIAAVVIAIRNRRK